MTTQREDFVRPNNPSAGLPQGRGTSPRPATTAANYKPAHGGYPGTPKLRNPQPFC